MIFIQKLLFASSILALVSCGTKKATVQKAPSKGKEIADERVRLRFDQAYLNGEREKALGNFDDALGYYEDAVRIYPSSSAAHYAMADLYLTKSRPDLAYASINKALALETTNSYYYDLKAQICHLLSKNNEAAEALKDVIRLNPGSVDAYFDAANEYIYAKDYKSALAIYDQMEARFGVGEDLVRQKEQIYLTMGKPEKAVEELKKLIEAAPGENRYQGMLAELYWQMGKKKESVEIYQSILKSEPSNGFAHFGMAEYYRSENKKEDMLRELNEAFKDGRINVQAKMNVLFSLIPLIENDRSLKEPLFKMAKTASIAHPNDAMTHTVLADLYFADSRESEALAEYEIAIAIDAGNLEVWKQYCSILLDLGKMETLQKESEKAIEYFPEQAILYYYQATALYRLKEYEKTAKTTKIGLSLYAPDEEINLQLYILQGDAFNNLKDFEASDKSFDKALILDPDNRFVLNNYAYYLSVRKAKLEKAKKMSARTLELVPDDASYLDTYGWILFQMNDKEGAVKYIAKSLEKEPNSPEVLEHMGDVLKELDRGTESIKYWKKALELNPDSKELPKKLDGSYKF